MANTAINEEVSSITKEQTIENKGANESPIDKKPIEDKAGDERLIKEKSIEEKAIDENPIVGKPIEEEAPTETIIKENEHPITDQLAEEEQSIKDPITLEDDTSVVSKQMRRQVRREKRNIRLEAQDRKNAADLSTREQSKVSLSSINSDSDNVSTRASQQRLKDDIPKADLKVDRSTLILDESYENVLLEAAMEEEIQISEEYCAVQFKDTFLNHFEDLPSLSEISLGESEEDVALSSFIQDETGEYDIKDIGVFVDPLTGEEVSSSSTEDVSIEEIVEADYEGHDVDDVELVSMHTSFDFTEKHELFEHDPFINFENVLDQDDDFIDELEMEAKIQARLALQITNDFLNELIKKVVVNAEIICEKVVLSKNIDKQKLYLALYDAIRQLISLRNFNQELNKKVVEYHKRRRYFRCIQPLLHAEEEREQRRYEKSLKYYDHLLKKEDDYNQLHSKRKAELQKSIAENKKLSLESEHHLETTMRNTFLDRHFDDFRSKIESFLKSMHKKREDISAARFILIQRQHTIATLLEELDNLGKINSNLLMNTFVTTQTEILGLEKKIEERNTDLNKLRLTCNSELINAAHLREKIDLFRRIIKNKMRDYTALSQQHREKREHLFKLKLEHVRIRKLIMDKSFQGGLLDKPVLMHDFDETIEAMEAQRSKIKVMREKLQSIANKIDMTEELYATQRHFHH